MAVAGGLLRESIDHGYETPLAPGQVASFFCVKDPHIGGFVRVFDAMKHRGW